MSSNIRVQRICQHCGSEFTAKTTVTKYCSDSCAKKAYKARKRAEKVGNAKQETRKVIARPMEEIKAKEFLSIAETVKLLGISRRTVYRLIRRGELPIVKLAGRTIVRRADLDRNTKPGPVPPPQPGPTATKQQIDPAQCYTIGEVLDKYSISDSSLRKLIQREDIPKIRRGKFALVPKAQIDAVLANA
ncbi:MAG: helix-turn-helix domain-containing protein [Bacteroidota bacterium]